MHYHKSKIWIDHLSKAFQSRNTIVKAVDDITLTIGDGEFFCIVGPSGCGKTTLLRILAGLEQSSSGSVKVYSSDDSRPVNSMVFQEQSVFPWMTVLQNIEYGLRMRHTEKNERKAAAYRYLNMMGLQNFAQAYPWQLSGGMKQRVSVARAFANDPEILLMDEPFGALDEQTRIILQQELLKIWEKSRKTTVFITHSIDEALCLGDRIMIMTARPGRVKAVIDIGLPRPRDLSNIRTTPHYHHLYQTIWSHLREEVLKVNERELTKK